MIKAIIDFLYLLLNPKLRISNAIVYGIIVTLLMSLVLFIIFKFPLVAFILFICIDRLVIFVDSYSWYKTLKIKKEAYEYTEEQEKEIKKNFIKDTFILLLCIGVIVAYPFLN